MTRILCAVLTLGLLAGVVQAGATPAAKCAAAKNKAAAKKIGSKLKCYQKAFVAGAAVDSTCLTNAELKFSGAIVKAGREAAV